MTDYLGASGPVVGVNLYALDNYSPADAETRGERMLSYIKDTLHATAVDIVWNFYAPSGKSNQVVATSATLSAQAAGILTQIAQRDHLQVEYRPLMFVQNVSQALSWEGHINPASPSSWFDSYYAINRPYLQMAQKYHVGEYVIGTEMDGVSADSQWRQFLANCARVYSGPLTYAAHESKYFPPSTQLPPARLAGMDMYEALNLPASAPLSQVVAAYESFFEKVPASLLHETAIQETGIQASDLAYAHPPNLGAAGSLDEAVQYNWFTAACETVKRFGLRGVFFWKVDLSDFPLTHPASSLSTFEGKQGAVAISQCASILGG